MHPIESKSPTRINPLDTERCIRVAQFVSEHLRRHSSHKLAGFDLVHITPNPAFSRLDGTNQWVLRFVEMLGGMLVLGRIAAAHVPTNETQAQVNPRIAGLNTLFAHMLIRFSYFDLIKVGAFFWHRFLLCLLAFPRRETLTKSSVHLCALCGSRFAMAHNQRFPEYFAASLFGRPTLVLSIHHPRSQKRAAHPITMIMGDHSC
jgi:hypothetical protein